MQEHVDDTHRKHAQMHGAAAGFHFLNDCVISGIFQNSSGRFFDWFPISWLINEGEILLKTWQIPRQWRHLDKW